MYSFDFATNVMNRIGFDSDAVTFFTEMSNKVNADEKLCRLIGKIREVFDLVERDCDKLNDAYKLCDELAETGGFNVYSVATYVYLVSCDIIYDKFKARGLNGEIFYDTMDDIRCKLLECRRVYGVNGCFVREWTFGFFKIDRFALGRMQYELAAWDGRPMIVGENTVYTGDKFVNLHIPSSGKPFDRAAREESYQKAIEFYKNEFDGVIPIGCSSWLLDPIFTNEMPTTNIADFAADFDAVVGKELDGFHDAWRVFGADGQHSPDRLPEDTNLQRVCKRRIQNGESFYIGYGIMFKKI